MTDAITALEKLSAEKFGRYGGSTPLPNERDEQVIEFLKLFTQLSSQEREAVRGRFTRDRCSILGGFADRMASLAVHRKDEEAIYLGMLALMVEGFKQDPRETIISQSLLYTSCKILGFDFKAISDRAVPFGPEVAGEAIQEFINRPEALKGADVMGFSVDVDAPVFICNEKQSSWPS